MSEELQVQLRDGSSISVEAEPQTVDWTTVHSDGRLSKQKIDFADISRLFITTQPASDQVSRIRKLLSQLGSENYAEREFAENELSKKEIGIPFRYLIEREKANTVFEVRYRVNRILRNLVQDRSLKAKTPSKFDRVYLANGQVLEGDVGEFQFRCKYGPQQLSFGRKEIGYIGTVRKVNEPEFVSKPVKVRPVLDFKDEFFLPSQVTIRFDRDENQNPIPKDTNVSELYTNQGLKLGVDSQGYVGVCKYTFSGKFDDLGVKAEKNTVCVHDTTRSRKYPSKFKGPMEFTFCVPGQSHQPAGVREFGLYLARVEHNRDFIMEAFSVDGHMIGYAEATDVQCVFLGIKSNEPMARLRVLSNPFLHRVNRKVDEDYAIDDVCFSTPEKIEMSPLKRGQVIRMKNGDLLNCESIEVADGQTIDVKLESLPAVTSVAVADVAEIRLNSEKGNPQTDWLGMLADRSVVRFETDKGDQCVTFDQQKLDRKKLVGMCWAQNPLRFPFENDFENFKHVLVFPTCRIATNTVELSNDLLKWGRDTKKYIQPIYTQTDPADDDDPTPSADRVELVEVIPSDIPSIWFRPPTRHDFSSGFVELIDGQKFMLGTDEKFELKQMGPDGITIEWRGQAVTYGWDKVVTVLFPNQ